MNFYVTVDGKINIFLLHLGKNLVDKRCCCKPQSSRLSNGHAAGTGREAGEEKGAGPPPPPPPACRLLGFHSPGSDKGFPGKREMNSHTGAYVISTLGP